MNIEERLAMIEDALGMSWGCREPKFHMVDQFAPKRATIKFNLNPDRAETLMETLEGVPGITAQRQNRKQHDPVLGTASYFITEWNEITITGPAE